MDSLVKMLLEILTHAVIDGNAFVNKLGVVGIGIKWNILGHVQDIVDALLLQFALIFGVHLIAQVQMRHDLVHHCILDGRLRLVLLRVR